MFKKFQKFWPFLNWGQGHGHGPKVIIWSNKKRFEISFFLHLEKVLLWPMVNFHFEMAWNWGLSLGTSIKDVPFFRPILTTIPCPTLSHFHISTQKRISQIENTPPWIQNVTMYLIFCLNGDNFFQFQDFLYKKGFEITTHKNYQAILKLISISHTQIFLQKSLRAGNQEEFPRLLNEKSDVLFWSINQPALFHFVPFCLTNQPSKKSDILYGCSFNAKVGGTSNGLPH